MLYNILNLYRERGSNPHAPFGARDFKRIFLSDYLISISFLTQGWTLLPVIKKINFSGSLYTFIGLPMLGSPSVLFIMVVILQPNSSNFLHERFHSRRDSTMYVVSPSCLPIPTSRHNLLYFNEPYILWTSPVTLRVLYLARVSCQLLSLEAQNFNELILRVHLDSNQDRRINSPQ